jgi:hypothetical protein
MKGEPQALQSRILHKPFIARSTDESRLSFIALLIARIINE